jgi:multidrug efflux pump subunit AcrB
MGGKLEVGMTIGLIMSIGFCVDFATHISYAYVTSPAPSGGAEDEQVARIGDALARLGWPIVQSALTTVAAVLPLCAAEAYLFRMLAWNISCIMVFGLFHGLAVLPVLFCLTSRGTKRIKTFLKMKREPLQVEIVDIPPTAGS